MEDVKTTGIFLEILSNAVVFGGFFFVWTFLFVRLFWKHIPLLPSQNRLRRVRWPGAFCVLILGMCCLLPSFILSFTVNFEPPAIQQEFRQISKKRPEAEPGTVEEPQTPSAQNFTQNSSVNSEGEKTPRAADFEPDSADVLSPSAADYASDSAPDSSADSSKTPNLSEKRTHHQIFEFLNTNPSCWKFLFMLGYAALLGPFFEEFVFRLVLQGWLDAREREIHRGCRGNGWRSVLVTAILFSFLHFRSGSSSYPSEPLLLLIFSVTAASMLVTLGVGILMLRRGFHLRWREFGFDFSHWKEDLRLGIGAFLAVALPTYMLQFVLNKYVGDSFAPDFLTLIPIALMFGILYWRTRRILPGAVAHCVFNSFSILQIMLMWYKNPM